MKMLIAISLSLLCAGCAGIDKAMTGSSAAPSREERQASVVRFNDLSEENKKNFVDGQPWVGMSADQLSSMWGSKPDKTQKKLTSRGNEEIQLYKIRVGDWKTGIKTQYYKATLLSGKVIEVQELDPSVGSFDKL